MKKGIIKDFIESAVVFLIVLLLSVTNLLSPLDYILRDGLYQIPRGVDSRIKIIAIDEATLEELGPIQTWSRSYYADLIGILNGSEASRPSVIAFDIIFSGYVDGEGDMAFARAAADSGNVVTASQFIYSEKSEIGEDNLRYYPIEAVVYPYKELYEATSQGYTNVAQDSDGVVRRVSIQETYDKAEQLSFSHAIYALYCEQQGIAANEIKTDRYGKTLINYSGKPNDYEYISMIDVLNGRIDSRTFQGSIVLIGAYAPGMQDNFNVPNGSSRQMFGVEIHANILQAFMQNRFSVNGNPYVFGVLWGVLAGIFHFIFKRNKRVWLSAILLILAIGGELAAGCFFKQ